MVDSGRLTIPWLITCSNRRQFVVYDATDLGALKRFRDCNVPGCEGSAVVERDASSPFSDHRLVTEGPVKRK